MNLYCSVNSYSFMFFLLYILFACQKRNNHFHFRVFFALKVHQRTFVSLIRSDQINDIAIRHIFHAFILLYFIIVFFLPSFLLTRRKQLPESELTNHSRGFSPYVLRAFFNVLVILGFASEHAFACPFRCIDCRWHLEQ
nr:MAG TPA_asm: hypothetical protein [Caudoviricetes sp.]